MTARAGMATLITRLRGMVEAGTADYTVNSAAYWTDDQLQDVLDQYRRDYRNEPIYSPGTIAAGGTIEYKEYLTGISYWSSDPVVQKYGWETEGTANYSFDAMRGVLTFTTNTVGEPRYISGSSYNLRAAAAEIWQTKASHYSGAYDFTTDNHSMKRSQLYDHAKEMASIYGISATIGSVDIERGDN